MNIEQTISNSSNKNSSTITPGTIPLFEGRVGALMVEYGAFDVDMFVITPTENKFTTSNFICFHALIG